MENFKNKIIYKGSFYRQLETWKWQHFCKLSFKLTIGLSRGSEPWYNVIIEDLPVSSLGLVQDSTVRWSQALLKHGVLSQAG